jgi:hypothetical protein
MRANVSVMIRKLYEDHTICCMPRSRRDYGVRR